MKKVLIICVIISVLIIIAVALILTRVSEDSWIKDKNGIWIKHGNPLSIPTEVEDQQKAINESKILYQQKKSEGMIFYSQCLGTVSGIITSYVVDIVHNPRIEEDNKQENQCEEYRSGNVVNFIELDNLGNVVRVV